MNEVKDAIGRIERISIRISEGSSENGSRNLLGCASVALSVSEECCIKGKSATYSSIAGILTGSKTNGCDKQARSEIVL